MSRFAKRFSLLLAAAFFLLFQLPTESYLGAQRGSPLHSQHKDPAEERVSKQPVGLSSSQGLPSARPEEVGLSSELLNRIHPAMQAYVDQGKLTGVVTLIAKRGKIVYLEQVGMMDRESGKPMRADTIFRIYSMTKPVTAVAVMMLCEAGKLRLEDPVSKFIPEMASVRVYRRGAGGNETLAKPNRPITIRDLLTHTSGLTYGVFEEGPVETLYKDAHLFSSATLREMVEKIARLPLIDDPGKRWNYSVASDVLGRVVEVVSGTSLGRFFEATTPIAASSRSC